jgi:hypothetical protein
MRILLVAISRGTSTPLHALNVMSASGSNVKTNRRGKTPSAFTQGVAFFPQT